MSIARTSHWVAALALSVCTAPALAQDTLDAKIREIAAPLVDEIIALVCDPSAMATAGNRIYVKKDADAFWPIQRSVLASENDWKETLLALGDRPDPPIYGYTLSQGEEGQLAYVNVLDFTDGRLPAARERRFTLLVPTANVSEWINGRRDNEQVPVLGQISFDDQLSVSPYDAAMVRRGGEWFVVVWRPEGQNSICLPDLGIETAPIASLLVDKYLVKRIAGDDQAALEAGLTFPLRLTFKDSETVTLEFTLAQDQLPPYLAVADFLEVEAQENKIALAILDLPLPEPLPLREIANAQAALMTSNGPVAMWTDVMIHMPPQDKGAHSYRIFARLPEGEQSDDAIDPDAIGEGVQQALKEGTADTIGQTPKAATVTQTTPKPQPEIRRYETIKVGFDVYLFGTKDSVAENLIVDRCDAILYDNGSKIGDLTLRETSAENERWLALAPASFLGNLPQVGAPRTEKISVTLQNAAENKHNQPCPLAGNTFDLRQKEMAVAEDTPFVLYQATLPHPDPTVVLAMSFPAQGDTGEKLSTTQARNYGYLLTQIAKGLEAAFQSAENWRYLTGYFGAFTLGNGTRFIRLDPPSDKSFSVITRDNWTGAKQELESDSYTLEPPTRAAFLSEAKSLLDPKGITNAPPRELIFINYSKTFDAGTGKNPCESNPALDTAGVTLTQIIVMFDFPAFESDFSIKGVPEDGSGVYFCDAPAREDLILIDAAAILQDDRHEQLPDVIRKILSK